MHTFLFTLKITFGTVWTVSFAKHYSIRKKSACVQYKLGFFLKKEMFSMCIILFMDVETMDTEGWLY